LAGRYKEIKQAEKQFGKATKNYAKQHAQMKSAKKSFHSAMALKYGAPPTETPPAQKLSLA
jgi:hypothetical protein